MKIAALLLAAGAGSRMGPDANKLLLETQGVPLVCRLADSALASRCDALFVVVGARAPEVLRALARRSLRIVQNDAWASGLASSIRAGVAAIAAQAPAFDALVVLLADQPGVTTAHIDDLLLEFERRPDHLVATRYAGTEGAPAVFPQRCFEALQQLDGDRGARSLIVAERESAESAPATSTGGRIAAVPFEAAALDIDTPDDYAELRQREGA